MVMDKTITVSVSLPASLVDRLDAEASRQSRTRSSMTRFVLEGALPEMAGAETSEQRETA